MLEPKTFDWRKSFGKFPASGWLEFGLCLHCICVMSYSEICLFITINLLFLRYKFLFIAFTFYCEISIKYTYVFITNFCFLLLPRPEIQVTYDHSLRPFFKSKLFLLNFTKQTDNRVTFVFIKLVGTQNKNIFLGIWNYFIQITSLGMWNKIITYLPLNIQYALSNNAYYPLLK